MGERAPCSTFTFYVDILIFSLYILNFFFNWGTTCIQKRTRILRIQLNRPSQAKILHINVTEAQSKKQDITSTPEYSPCSLPVRTVPGVTGIWCKCVVLYIMPAGSTLLNSCTLCVLYCIILHWVNFYNLSILLLMDIWVVLSCA